MSNKFININRWFQYKNNKVKKTNVYVPTIIESSFSTFDVSEFKIEIYIIKFNSRKTVSHLTVKMAFVHNNQWVV